MVCKLAGLLAALPPPAPPTAQSFPPLAAQLSCQSETLRGHSSATMPLLCLQNQDATAVLQFSVCHTLHYSFLSVVVKFLSRAKKKKSLGAWQLATGARTSYSYSHGREKPCAVPHLRGCQPCECFGENGGKPPYVMVSDNWCTPFTDTGDHRQV